MVIHIPRTRGQLTNLWELIQAAYDEDRQRAHEEATGRLDPVQSVLEEVQRRRRPPFVPDRRSH